MIELILLIVSDICKKTFALIFLLIGIVVSSCRWELRKYLKEVAIMNDVYLNVVGQHTLNGALSANGKGFGNRLQSISCAMGIVPLTKFGKACDKGLDILEKEHCKKAVQIHKLNITKEFYELPND